MPLKPYLSVSGIINHVSQYYFSGSKWQTVDGRFISVIAANMSCACAKSPEGLSPSAHLADGCMDLILVKHTSRFQYLRHMLRLASKADHVSMTSAQRLSVGNCQYVFFQSYFLVQLSIRWRLPCQRISFPTFPSPWQRWRRERGTRAYYRST